jgi:hypothetical protein
MIDLDNLIFRSHSCGDLCGQRGLGVTGQKKALQSYREQFFDRTKEIKSKYLEKGLLNESGAIDMINRVHGLEFVKNEIRLTNEYLTGECDIIEKDFVADVKNSWDLFTFDEAHSTETKDYEWQLRAYMELYDKPKAQLYYCLTNMNHEQLNAILFRMSNAYPDNDLPDLLAIRVVKNAIFDIDDFHLFLEKASINRNNVAKEIDKFVHIPEKDRVVKFELDRDKTKTDFLYSRIKEARQFLKTKFQ